jgi:glucose/mannose transport system permease protein
MHAKQDMLLPGQDRLSYRIGRMAIYLGLALIALVYLFPLIVVLLTSIKTMDDIHTGSLISLPRVATFEPWIVAWSQACVGLRCEGIHGYFANTVMMVVPAVLISTAIGAVNGYVLTQWRFKGADLIFALILFGCFIPYQIVLIPMAHVLGLMGLASTITGLVIVHVCFGIAFTTMFFRNFLITLSPDLVNAARVDGARFFTIFRRIVVPVSVPCFMVCFIWQFTNVWNDYIFGATFTSGDSSPITVALNNIVNTTTGDRPYNIHMATVIITAMPTLLVYFFAGKYFLRGLMAGSVKG